MRVVIDKGVHGDVNVDVECQCQEAQGLDVNDFVELKVGDADGKMPFKTYDEDLDVREWRTLPLGKAPVDVCDALLVVVHLVVVHIFDVALLPEDVEVVLAMFDIVLLANAL